MDTESTDRFRLRADGITWRELDEQIVVLDLQSGRYLTVSGAGTVVWQLLIEGATLEQLVDAVDAVFDVPPATARADLVAFVDELKCRELLR